MLNHAVAVSGDGKTVYVSSQTYAWRYAYNASTQTVSGMQIIVKGMNYTGGHVTRSILTLRVHPNLLVVQRGSGGNLDMPAYNITTARAVVKVFDLNKVPAGGYEYATGGKFMGYGLRNDVGLVEDKAGGVWSVENSSDEVVRKSNGTDVDVDVHTNNPAEVLQY
ncbi:hypothetical protein HK104_007800, partial [Borealophlyctis nickersoniae]